jgi:Ca2+-binding RTX toxin-like protein
VPVNSVGVRFINDEWVQGIADRNLHVLGIQVNGNDLPITEAMNPTANGQGAMWFNSTLSIDTSSRQDHFTGATTDDDTLDAGAGDDTLTGGAGNDYLDGGESTDTAVYGGLKAQYAVSEMGGGLVQVRDLRIGSAEGHDTLKDVELLRFSDGTYSLQDFLNAGTTTGSPGDDTIVLTAALQNLTIDLQSGNDTLMLADGDNAGTVANVEQLLGGAGNDAITLKGALLSFTMDGGAGLDSLQLANGANRATLANVETVTGGTGNDDVAMTTDAGQR